MRVRVLLVDDETNMLETHAAVLGDDVDVVTCTSPDRALRIADAQPFDVVCSDFDMPGMNGAELLRQVAIAHPHIGTLLVTGAQRYLSSGAGALHDVLIKPVDPVRFIAIVQQLGRIAQMRRGAAGGDAPSVERSGPQSGRR